MPKVTGPTMKYVVSFNAAAYSVELENSIEMGNCEKYTTDFEGNDIDSLADEVNIDDPNFQMRFVKEPTYDDDDDDDYVVGWFIGVDDDDDDFTYPTAVMTKRSFFE